MSPSPRTASRPPVDEEREAETTPVALTKERAATKEDASLLREHYLDGLAITTRIARKQREAMHNLALGPELGEMELDADYQALAEIRVGLDEIPLGTRANGASVSDVIGALFGVKTRADCRRICKEAFGR